MQSFLQRFGALVLGVLCGWDRLRFRGTKRYLACEKGMMNFLWQQQILLKDFGDYARQATDQLRAATEQFAQQHGRTVQYLNNSQLRKEDLARELIRRDGLQQGLVAIFSAVEPCWSYELHKDRAAKKLVLRGGQRKCLHYYHYYLDPHVGLYHARLQSWFPFTLHVNLNGREWLARQLDAAGIGYVRRENCFSQVADFARAQTLLDEQSRVDWPQLLARLTQHVHPTEAALFANCPVPYYWSADQTEWATDVAFCSAAALASWYPSFVRHGLLRLSSADVLRFLGKKISVATNNTGRFAGEVLSDLVDRADGVRVKHRVNGNSVKMYDKQQTVLRVETTIQENRDFKVYRTTEKDPEGTPQWQRLRKGVADLHRRGEISQAANDRYLSTLATVAETRPLGELAAGVCQATQWSGRRVRALNPLSPADSRLLAAVNRGEFVLRGFRNRDVRALLYGKTASDTERQRQGAAVTRQLRLLRAHGLIQKIPKTHSYRVSAKGQTVLTALLTARDADVNTLVQAA